MEGSTTWTFTYDVNGMRTKRTNGSSTYNYGYHGSQLTHMTYGNITLHFYYDASGRPLSVTYNNATYYYVLNLQGDVVAILDSTGNKVVGYRYDAWGRLLETDGSMESTLGQYNPLRYRGYVYDEETGLYYVSSRYYNPEIGRWINADAAISGVGGNILGYNMFAYCFNNPVNMSDPDGNWPKLSTVLMGIAVAATTVAAVAFCVAMAPVIVGVGTASATAIGIATAAAYVAGGSGVAALVIGVVENTPTKNNYRNQSVYVMRDGTTKDVQYVGRTNNPVRRQGEHDKDPNKEHLDPLEVKFTGLSLIEARIVEQIVISAYTIENLDNARREIAVGNLSGFADKMENIIKIFIGANESELLSLMEGDENGSVGNFSLC